MYRQKDEPKKGGKTMKLTVKKAEEVATCHLTADYGPVPWKEVKKHCL